MIYYDDNMVIIRSMVKKDIDKIFLYFKDQGWYKPKKILESYFVNQNSGNLYALIAEYNDDVTGYTILYPNSKNAPFKDKNIPEISDFNVFTNYHRKGIGNKILDVAENIASKTCDTVSLGVGLHYGYGTAQRIYIKRDQMEAEFGTIIFVWNSMSTAKMMMI